jgi:hypothetical protein
VFVHMGGESAQIKERKRPDHTTSAHGARGAGTNNVGGTVGRKALVDEWPT